MILGILLQISCLLSNETGRFDVVYRPDLRCPIEVSWRLCPGDLGNVKRERSFKFVSDSRVPMPRALSSDYIGTGFDRGHMCPAADRSASVTAMRATFIMTNVCPQVPALNRGEWKRAEEQARKYVRAGRSVIVRAYALFFKADTLRIGANGVAVPHGFVREVRTCSGDSIIYARYFQNY